MRGGECLAAGRAPRDRAREVARELRHGGDAEKATRDAGVLLVATDVPEGLKLLGDEGLEVHVQVLDVVELDRARRRVGRGDGHVEQAPAVVRAHGEVERAHAVAEAHLELDAVVVVDEEALAVAETEGDALDGLVELADVAHQLGANVDAAVTRDRGSSLRPNAGDGLGLDDGLGGLDARLALDGLDARLGRGGGLGGGGGLGRNCLGRRLAGLGRLGRLGLGRHDGTPVSWKHCHCC